MIKLTQDTPRQEKKRLKCVRAHGRQKTTYEDETSETQHETHTQLQKIRRKAIVVEETTQGSDGREKEETREEIKRDKLNCNKIIRRQDKARGGKRNL